MAESTLGGCLRVVPSSSDLDRLRNCDASLGTSKKQEVRRASGDGVGDSDSLGLRPAPCTFFVISLTRSWIEWLCLDAEEPERGTGLPDLELPGVGVRLPEAQLSGECGLLPPPPLPDGDCDRRYRLTMGDRRSELGGGVM